jgi:hypothetical protein
MGSHPITPNWWTSECLSDALQYVAERDMEGKSIKWYTFILPRAEELIVFAVLLLLALKYFSASFSRHFKVNPDEFFHMTLL